MNVGASKPSDAGLYFQWGDTSGYTAEQVGKDKQFNWSDYKWSLNGSDTNFIKYKTPGAKLELEDDAAHVHMGGDWHMPNLDQCKELIYGANTLVTSTTQDGVDGFTITSKKDNSKSIFIPTTGYAYNGSVNARVDSFIWSSTIYTYGIAYAKALNLDYDIITTNEKSRHCGLSIRGVIG